jgi:hypothetical protein
MRRRVTELTPSYAAEVIASAQISSPRLVASVALFVMLLAGMSLVECPTASDVEAPAPLLSSVAGRPPDGSVPASGRPVGDQPGGRTVVGAGKKPVDAGRRQS